MTPSSPPVCLSTALAAVLGAGAALPAQGPATLVRDINTTTPSVMNPGSNFREGFDAGPFMLFQGTTDLTSSALFRTDGTAAGTVLVKDINPGPDTSSPFGFVELVPGVYLFQGREQSTGQELWRTDGSTSGTTLVKNIRPGPESAMQFPAMVNLGGRIYFSAHDGATGFELWSSNGTAAGTQLVTEIRPGIDSASPNNLTVLGGTLFFTANDGINGTELWKSDGTAAGTMLVGDLNPGSASASPSNLAVYGGRLFFTVFEPNFGRELYVTDGVTTSLVADIASGTASGNPTGLVVFGGLLYFTANDGVNGSELWRSDGTAAGTVMVADLEPGSTGSFPGFLTPVGSRLFFQARVAADSELYAFDGTTVYLVADINPAGSSGPNRLADIGGKLFFTANDGITGTEPWVSDGTLAGTMLLADINQTANRNGDSLVDRVHTFGGFAYFPGFDGNVQEIYRTDGTPAGTGLFLTLNTPRTHSSPNLITDSGQVQTGFFGADDGVAGLELWKSSGTGGSTVRVADLNAGPGGSVIGNITRVGSLVFFTADDGSGNFGRELYVSDGTIATLVLDIRPGASGSFPFNLVEYKGALFFSANDGTNGSELWRSDGTALGTVMVADIRAGSSSSSPSELTVVNDRLFFNANDGTNGAELWVTDGSPAGTTLLRDIRSGTSGSFPTQLTAYRDRLFFRANDGSGNEPWISDGSAAGTVILADLNSSTATASSNPLVLGIANDLLFFTADDGSTGTELFRTDGTSSGTVQVKDIAPGAADSDPVGFADLGGLAVFMATDSVSGFEPWRTDGTTAGTVQIADVLPGELGSFSSRGFCVAPRGSRRALFAATNGFTGVEIYRTDGTAAGTVLHQDLNPGAANSNPGAPVQVGCKLLFAATDASGEELWGMDSMASASAYGVGCPGSGGLFPHISGSGGAPTLGNAGFGVKVRNALPSSSTFVLLHFGRAILPLGNGCTYYGNPATLILAAAVGTNGSGEGTVPLPIPANGRLACVQLFAQHAVLDPNGAYLNALALSEGLKIVLNIN